MGWKSDDDIDAIFIIDGEEVENDGEWKGLTQTMNRNFIKENNQTKQEVKQQIALVEEKISQDVKLIKEDVKLAREEIKQEIKQEMKLAEERTKA